MYLHQYVHKYMHIYIYIDTYVYMYEYIHMYIYISLRWSPPDASAGTTTTRWTVDHTPNNRLLSSGALFTGPTMGSGVPVGKTAKPLLEILQVC